MMKEKKDVEDLFIFLELGSLESNITMVQSSSLPSKKSPDVSPPVKRNALSIR